MKPRLLTILILLVLGAIVNVAVAWGSVAWLGATLDVPADPKPRPEVARMVRDHVPASAPVAAMPGSAAQPNVQPLVTLEARAAASVIDGISWANAQTADTTGQRAPHIEAFITRAGWPMHALIGGRLMKSGSQDQVRGALAVGGFRSVPWLPRDLPYRPLWPGFAINTVFYAVILWALFAAPFALRRRRRIRRGLCPACAYPVGASDICTECGRQLPSPSR